MSTSSADLLRKWCNFGWQYRGLNRLKGTERKRYAAQGKYEIDLMIEKDFQDYFLVMSDAIRAMKDRGIPVGPGRGSSAASLVCYLLRITEIDPMQFPVMQFERFMDPNRSDLPDIDTDFDDDFRDEVRKHFVQKHGESRVGNIGTFLRYKGKNSLDDIARVHSLPSWEINRIKDYLADRVAGDEDTGHDLEDALAAFPQVREVFDKYPDLYQAIKLEGNLKGFGVHAAGIVVGSSPLSDSVATYARQDTKTKETRAVLSVDMKDSEHLGLMKLDALGLKTMGMIRIALELIGMSLEDLYRIPLTDEKTLKLFEENDVVGIFQFEGGAARTVTQQMKAKNFMDLAAINTLARPGALHSGSTGDYLQIRHGRMERKDPHPIFAKITQDTEGQIIYQEQMVQLVREIGGFDWALATKVRKNIAKSKGADSFRPMWESFRDGAEQLHGIPESVSKEMWDRLTAAGSYAFNAAHSVAYSALGFWCAWLKAHHPIEFYTAQLRKIDVSSDTGKARLKSLLRDIADHGLAVHSVNLEMSSGTWEPVWEHPWLEPGVIAGYSQIKGIGEKQAEAILEAKEKLGGFEDWTDLIHAKGIGAAKMRDVMAFAEDPDPFGIGYLGAQTARIKSGIRAGDYADCPFPDTVAEDIPYEAETSFHKVLVVVNNRIPKNLYEQHRMKHGTTLDRSDVKDPDLADYMTLHAEDVSGPVTISINRFLFPQVQEQLEAMELGKDFVVVAAKKMATYGKVLLAKDMWFIEPESD